MREKILIIEDDTKISYLDADGLTVNDFIYKEALACTS